MALPVGGRVRVDIPLQDKRHESETVVMCIEYQGCPLERTRRGLDAVEFTCGHQNTSAKGPSPLQPRGEEEENDDKRALSPSTQGRGERRDENETSEPHPLTQGAAVESVNGPAQKADEMHNE